MTVVTDEVSSEESLINASQSDLMVNGSDETLLGVTVVPNQSIINKQQQLLKAATADSAAGGGRSSTTKPTNTGRGTSETAQRWPHSNSFRVFWKTLIVSVVVLIPGLVLHYLYPQYRQLFGIDALALFGTVAVLLLFFPLTRLVWHTLFYHCLPVWVYQRTGMFGNLLLLVVACVDYLTALICVVGAMLSINFLFPGLLHLPEQFPYGTVNTVLLTLMMWLLMLAVNRSLINWIKYRFHCSTYLERLRLALFVDVLVEVMREAKRQRKRSINRFILPPELQRRLDQLVIPASLLPPSPIAAAAVVGVSPVAAISTAIASSNETLADQNADKHHQQPHTSSITINATTTTTAAASASAIVNNSTTNPNAAVTAGAADTAANIDPTLSSAHAWNQVLGEFYDAAARHKSLDDVRDEDEQIVADGTAADRSTSLGSSSINGPLLLQPTTAHDNSNNNNNNNNSSRDFHHLHRPFNNYNGDNYHQHLNQHSLRRQYPHKGRRGRPSGKASGRHQYFDFNKLDERAEQLAGKIFNSLKDPECQRLDIERNLLPLFAGQRDDNGKRRLTPIETEESAAKDQHYASIHQAILLFFNKPRERSRISRDELVYHIKRSFREQARLMASLAGMSAAIDQVGNAMRGFLCFILLLVTMSIFGVNVFNALVSLSSAIVSLAFLFGASAKNAFDSAIFLFFIHPYDVGDRIIVDGQNYVVQQINLLSTVLEEWTGRVVSMPNSMLSRQDIYNQRRSNPIGEIIQLQVSFSTPSALIGELQRRMLQYVTDESADFGSKSTVQIDQFMDLETMTLKVYYAQKSNKQDYALYLARRTKFMRALITQLKELDITWVPLERSLITASTPAVLLRPTQLQQQPPEQPR